MFTQNYIKFRRMMFVTGQASLSASMVSANGTSFTAYPHRGGIADVGGWMARGRCQTINEIYTGTTPQNSTYFGVFFGTDSTPATKNDYCLGSPITSGLSITNGANTPYTEEEEGVYSFYAIFTVKNTTDSDINIYEIGTFTPVSTASGFKATASSDTYYAALMERTVLTEPITIPAGESKLVTYKLTFNQTLNVE